jgi:hypothetical protein
MIFKQKDITNVFNNFIEYYKIVMKHEIENNIGRRDYSSFKCYSKEKASDAICYMNTGDCFCVALSVGQVLTLKYGYDIKYEHNGSHIYISCNNKFYDSFNVRGVKTRDKMFDASIIYYSKKSGVTSIPEFKNCTYTNYSSSIEVFDSMLSYHDFSRKYVLHLGFLQMYDIDIKTIKNLYSDITRKLEPKSFIIKDFGKISKKKLPLISEAKETLKNNI